jgi:hypothetical protein
MPTYGSKSPLRLWMTVRKGKVEPKWTLKSSYASSPKKRKRLELGSRIWLMVRMNKSNSEREDMRSKS